jgi:hypothetical protein
VHGQETLVVREQQSNDFSQLLHDDLSGLATNPRSIGNTRRREVALCPFDVGPLFRSYRVGPLPIADFRQILAVRVNKVLVLDQLVAHLLFEIGPIDGSAREGASRWLA